MKHFYPILFIFLLLISCQSDNKKASSTYFGGQIINPKDKYVILFKDDKVIDSILLDENNMFATSIQHCSPGLYHFYHKPEYQYIYLEPNDSLLLRLNTLAFDESLVFSGVGSEKNNFLIETFLGHEKNEASLFNPYKANSFYKLESHDFKDKIDSLKNIQLSSLEKKTKEYQFSKEFLKLAEASIDLGIYDKIETYPLYNRKSNLDNSFYQHREQLNLDNDMLFTYHPYHNYLYTFANNVAMSNCSNNCNKEQISLKSPHFNHLKLKVLDSLIEHETLKNFLTKRAALEFLENTTCKNKAREYYAEFAKINTDRDVINEVKQITVSISNLEVGNRIPDLKVKSNAKLSSLTKVVNKNPTVFYFWTTNSPRHLKVVHEKVAMFEKDHEGISFVGINLDQDQKAWNSIINNYQFDEDKEFQLANLDHAKQALMLSSVHKVIIVDNKGTIVSTKANLFDTKFGDHLNSLFK